MPRDFAIDEEGLKRLLELQDDSKSPLEDFDLPAAGHFLPLANACFSDFLRTSGYDIGDSKVKGKETGTFEVHFDPTPFIVSIFNWLLNKIGAWILKRRRGLRPNQEYAGLSEQELDEIHRLVIDIGEQMSDKSVFTPESSRKMADSICRTLIRNPGALLLRKRTDRD